MTSGNQDIVNTKIQKLIDERKTEDDSLMNLGAYLHESSCKELVDILNKFIKNPSITNSRIDTLNNTGPIKFIKEIVKSYPTDYNIRCSEFWEFKKGTETKFNVSFNISHPPGVAEVRTITTSIDRFNNKLHIDLSK